MRRGWILLTLLASPAAAAEESFRHGPFSRFYTPTEMFLEGKRSVAAQYGIEKGAERSLDEFSRDDGDLSGRFTDVHAILTDGSQRVQIGAFFSTGLSLYDGVSSDLATARETKVGNRTDYSIVGFDLSSRINSSWSWALRMQSVQYTLRVKLDQFSLAYGSTHYSAYSPSLAWQEGPWAVRLSYQPTINYRDQYPVRLSGNTRLSVLRGTMTSSWGVQLTSHRERAIEKEDLNSHEVMVGGEERRGAWGVDAFAAYRSRSWDKAHLLRPKSLERFAAGAGVKWLNAGDYVLGTRFETVRAPKVSRKDVNATYEADVIKDTITLYIDYLIDAKKDGAPAAPSSDMP